MIIGLPLIGVASSGLIWQAIESAHHVLSLLRDQRRKLEELLAAQFQYSVVSPSTRDIRAGDRPPTWLPRILGTVWLILLSLIATDVVANVIRFGVFAIATDAS